jgi:hypothetical protein
VLPEPLLVLVELFLRKLFDVQGASRSDRVAAAHAGDERNDQEDDKHDHLISAIHAAVPANNPKPRIATMIATTRNTSAHPILIFPCSRGRRRMKTLQSQVRFDREPGNPVG